MWPRMRVISPVSAAIPEKYERNRGAKMIPGEVLRPPLDRATSAFGGPLANHIQFKKDPSLRPG